MEVKIVAKESFTVIGKSGQGLASEGFKWVPPLWKETMTNYNEIEGLEKLDESGNKVGMWGAMSDPKQQYLKWDDEGRYIAGVEVEADVISPQGWDKWTIPSFLYATVLCTQETYGDAFGYILKDYMPQENLELVGAVHEFYDPKCKEGELYLYFPIKRL